MNIIQQAAEAIYPSHTHEPEFRFMAEYCITHFLSYLAAQGDDLMMVDMFRPLYQDLSDMTSRGHRLHVRKVSWQEAAELLSRARELSKQALAIGRAMEGQWICVMDRLPEKEDADENGYVDVCTFLRNQKPVRGKYKWDRVTQHETKSLYWMARQPLPEPPKSDL